MDTQQTELTGIKLFLSSRKWHMQPSHGRYNTSRQLCRYLARDLTKHFDLGKIEIIYLDSLRNPSGRYKNDSTLKPYAFAVKFANVDQRINFQLDSLRNQYIVTRMKP